MRLRRLAAALLAVLLVAPGQLPVRAAQTADDDLPVRVAVESLSPVLLPAEEAALRVTGRVTNTGDEPLRRLRVQLWLGDPVTSRSRLGEQPPAIPQGRRVATETLGDLGAAAADSLPFAFEIPVAELALDPDTPHVYRLRVEVRSRGDRRAGHADTFLPWFPRETARSPVAWLWPLAETSHRSLDGRFRDDGLLEELTEGRLATLLRVGADTTTPLTWAIDAELVASVAMLARGAIVRGARRPGDESAREWLDLARSAVRGAPVLPLPYGDPDLAAVVRTPLGEDVARAVRLGTEHLRATLGVRAAADLAWPPNGEIDQRTLALLTGAGARGIVVSDSALPLEEGLTYTPTAPYPFAADGPGGPTALVADSTLAALLEEGAGAQGRRLAVQRFLAETAMIALERPNDPRTIVVTPPRDWDPEAGYAAQLLALTAHVPWLLPTTLDRALRQPPSTARRTLHATTTADRLPTPYVRSVVTARGLLERYRSILEAPDDLATQLDEALLRATSVRWRDRLGGGQDLVRTVLRTLSEQFGKLQVATGGVVTLAGRSGSVPITILNDIGQDVRVRVKLRSSFRLELESRCYDTGCPVTVPPGRLQLVVRGEAVAAGVSPVEVELLPPSPDDTPLLRATLRVRSRSYGTLALVITVGALALLLTGSVVRLVRRRRRPTAGDGAAA